MLYKVTDESYSSILADGAYKKLYMPGTIVEALAGTVGIMIFNNFLSAKIFTGYRKFAIDYPRILEVEGIGTPSCPELISFYCSESSIKDFYRIPSNCKRLIHPPTGTICFPKIRVLQEITS